MLLMNLPSPILIDILSRLPPKDIIRGRCICKTWNNFVSDPEFVNLHYSKAPIYFLVNNLSSSPPDSSYFSLVEFQDDLDHRHHLQQLPGIQLQLPKTTPNAEMEIIGLINGFVCICESSRPRNTLYIWNPILREFITFQAPEFPGSSDGNIASYGFGLSSKKGEYKVVQISKAVGNAGWEKTKCHVYTLGTRSGSGSGSGSWRSIENVKFNGFCRGHAVFIEGNLHWLVEFGSHILYCLDLENETIEPFPSPSLNEEYRKATLNFYNDCLCVCDNTEEYDVKVWVMTEYGKANSWSKLVEITEDPVGSLGNYFDSVYFVRVFNDGEILILLGKTIMFFRLPDGGTFDEVDARVLVRHCETRISDPEEHFYSTTFEAVEFVPSFISPRNLGEHVVKKSDVDYDQIVKKQMSRYSVLL